MKLLASVDNNWAIGFKDGLLVTIPEDMKRFMKLTAGKVVVLGRKSLQNFPNGLPLRDRVNIILTSNKNLKIRGAVMAYSEEELLELLQEYDSDDIYVIGGESVFNMLYEYCDRAFLTKINYKYQADKHFPNLDKLDNWELVDEDDDEQTYFSIEYNYVTYRNNNPKAL